MYSLVVVAWECEQFVERLVDSMNAHLDGSQELVLVDNNSSDNPNLAGQRWKGPYRFVGLDETSGLGRARMPASGARVARPS